MKRAKFGLAIAGLLLWSPAYAATLVHPTAAAMSVEQEVTVWRGPKPSEAAETKSSDRHCHSTNVSVTLVGFAPRALRTHGFWSGRTASRLSYGIATSGFYADRIRAGL